MKDQVLWRKTARIAFLLSERLGVEPEQALNLLYNSHTYSLLENPESGMQLLSDEYILNDLLQELNDTLK